VVEVDLDAPDNVRELKGHRLLCVGDIPVIATMIGPVPGNPQLDEPLKTKSNPHAIAPLEWSNLIARIVNGCVEENGPTRTVKCYFTQAPCEDHHEPWVKDCGKYIEVELEVRPFFEKETAVISEALAHPGELTQGLCSPWQNDYRECSCYYWASARPDYINVEPTPDGLSTGDNWLQKKRTGDYVPDDYQNPELVLYNDLFSEWEKWLRFQIGGRDAPGEATPVPPANVDENEIRRLAAARAEAFDRKDLEASLAFYAPDAMILWPGAPVASGADALRKKLREKLSDPTLRIQFAPKSITLSKAKDFASDFGEVTFMCRDARTNKPVFTVQKYVQVWRKICDEWKVMYDSYNADTE
jgi:ketosteroid isomerase-like protein